MSGGAAVLDPGPLEVLGIDLLNDVVDRLFHDVEERLRIEADPEHADHERDQRPLLAQVEVLQFLVLRVVERAPEERW